MTTFDFGSPCSQAQSQRISATFGPSRTSLCSTTSSPVSTPNYQFLPKSFLDTPEVGFLLTTFLSKQPTTRCLHCCENGAPARRRVARRLLGMEYVATNTTFSCFPGCQKGPSKNQPVFLHAARIRCRIEVSFFCRFSFGIGVDKCSDDVAILWGPLTASSFPYNSSLQAVFDWRKSQAVARDTHRCDIHGVENCFLLSAACCCEILTNRLHSYLPSRCCLEEISHGDTQDVEVLRGELRAVVHGLQSWIC